MKKNDYQNLMEHIQPPAGLNDRVLSAARQTAGAQKETTGPKHLAPGKRRPVLRAAVCAACALALVVGSVTLGPIGGGEPGESGAPVTALPSFSFGLTAYAADTGERYEANANGGLAFSTAGQVSWSAEGGHYTGCLFQVTGENIRTISLAIDREALYRSRTLTNLSREEVQNLSRCRGQRHGVPAFQRRRSDPCRLWRGGRGAPDHGGGDGSGRCRHGGL